VLYFSGKGLSMGTIHIRILTAVIWTGGLTILALAGQSSRAHSKQGERVSSARLVVGRETRLGGDEGRSQWEASLVVSRKDPRQLLVSCILGNFTGSGVFYSADGGQTWKDHKFPNGHADPIVAFGPDGAGYIAYLGKHGEDDGLFLHRSGDGGKTWGPAIRLPEKGKDHIDHPMIAIDHTGGKFGGRVYVGAYSVKDGVLVHRSSDGGRTFKTAAAVPSWDKLFGFVHNLLVLSDGTLFVPLAQVDHSRGRFHKRAEFSSVVSTDGGVTFSRPRKIVGPVKTFVRVEQVSNVVCAAGPHKGKERVYALWSERLDGAARMRLTFSDDAGATWSKPRDVIAELPPGEEHGACNVAVSKDGTLGLSWLCHQPEKRYDAWFTASVDGGMTFLPPVKVSGKSSRVLLFQERPNPGDDYLLMDSGPEETFHVIWPDARAGTVYQLYTCKVQVVRTR
jgi:hypothetical protein